MTSPYFPLNGVTPSKLSHDSPIFDEVDFSFSASPCLTNDLDIFQQDDYPGTAPMPAPLLAPHVLLGFPPLVVAGSLITHLGGPIAPRTAAGGQTVSPGGHTALRKEAGNQTMSPDSQIAPCIEGGSQTTTLGGLTTRTYAAPSSPT
jgi:hypothetical protein